VRKKLQLADGCHANVSPLSVVTLILPPLQQLNALPKLLSRGLINTAPGARNQFGVQPAMIDAAGSRDGADEQPVKFAQVLFLLMEGDRWFS
jgi:hypothetical protein